MCTQKYACLHCAHLRRGSWVAQWVEKRADSHGKLPAPHEQKQEPLNSSSSGVHWCYRCFLSYASRSLSRREAVDPAPPRGRRRRRSHGGNTRAAPGPVACVLRRQTRPTVRRVLPSSSRRDVSRVPRGVRYAILLVPTAHAVLDLRSMRLRPPPMARRPDGHN